MRPPLAYAPGAARLGADRVANDATARTETWE